jgi:hypothetical protein
MQATTLGAVRQDVPVRADCSLGGVKSGPAVSPSGAPPEEEFEFDQEPAREAEFDVDRCPSPNPVPPHCRAVVRDGGATPGPLGRGRLGVSFKTSTRLWRGIHCFHSCEV